MRRRRRELPRGHLGDSESPEHQPLGAGAQTAMLAALLDALAIVSGASDDLFAQTDADYLAATFPRSRGIRRVPGGKLFFPEEYPDLLAEEAQRLWENT